MSQLKQLGALSAAEDLTPLGHHLALLPLDIRLGKVLIYGAMLRCVHTQTPPTTTTQLQQLAKGVGCYRCIDPMLTIAAGMSGRTPFRSPLDRRDEAGACKRTFDWGNSDHLALVKVVQWLGWQHAPAQYD